MQELKGRQQLPIRLPRPPQWVPLQPGGLPLPHVQPNLWGAHAPSQESASTLQHIAWAWVLPPPMGSPPPWVPYPSILVKNLHHHHGGLVLDSLGVPVQQHPLEKQRLVPEWVQSAGQHPGALADVHEGDVGDGVWGTRTPSAPQATHHSGGLGVFLGGVPPAVALVAWGVSSSAWKM